jgi:TatD DNase family protein
MKPDFEFIDTHAHLYLPEFDMDREEMMQRAVHQGVTKIFLPNIDTSSVEPMLKMENDYPGICHAMIGLHPCSVDPDFRDTLDILKSWLDGRGFAAIGEIGTDLYWDTKFRDQQILCFEEQLTWAKARNLPVVLHSRDSLDLNIEIIGHMQDGNLRGVFHCFTGTPDQAKCILDLGFYLGIGGVLTFKNSGLAESIAHLPLTSYVLETDSPYLSPHPYRGQRNESGYIRLIGERLSAVLNVPLETICESTTRNAETLFSINS